MKLFNSVKQNGENQYFSYIQFTIISVHSHKFKFAITRNLNIFHYIQT